MSETPTTRRKLPAPAATATPPVQAEVPASNGTVESTAHVEEELTANNSALPDVPEFYSIQAPALSDDNDVSDMTKLRDDVESLKRMLMDLHQSSRNLPLSRDTVYYMGATNGHFEVLLMLINQDIAAQQ